MISIYHWSNLTQQFLRSGWLFHYHQSNTVPRGPSFHSFGGPQRHLYTVKQMTRLDSLKKFELEHIFNRPNPTYLHEVVIIPVSHVVAVVVEIMQHNTTKVSTHTRRILLTKVNTVVPLRT
jgi:hypothetical protein